MTRIRSVAQLLPRGRRGSAQLGLLLAAVAVAGGMAIGSGVADRHAKSGYDLAWLTDSKNGQLVQVDPVLGRANVRLQVAGKGSDLSIQQGNGQLVVTDRKTGRITSIDLGTLLVGGSRAEHPGNTVKVLLAGARLYVADLTRGSVQAVDPATQADIGTPWSAGRALVDVGVDGSQQVWALDTAKNLRNLAWNGTTLRPVATRTVAGAGPGSVIVGHDRGVTVVGAGGAIVRVGTGNDRRLDAPRINGPLTGPLHSPGDLVPVSNPGTSSVVIVGSGDAVVDDVSGYGCERPGTPTVFDGKVYVPCSGAHKVLVLGADGRQVGAAIPVPGGADPQLTVSGDRLVIDVPGSGRATVIDTSGGRHDFPTQAPGIGVQNPNTPPPDPPQPPDPTPSSHPSHGGGGNHGGNSPSGINGDGHGSGHGNGHDSGHGSDGDPSGDGATATARADGSVLVSWPAKDGAGATSVTATSTGDEVATVPAGATSATVTVLSPGTTTAFQVRNAKLRATTNTVTTSAAPGAVSNLAVASQGVTDGFATLSVTWTAAAANGTRVSYAVAPKGGALTTTTANLNATVRVPCGSGCTGTITVTPRNAAGNGATASAAYTVTGSAPAPAPTTANPAPAPEPTTAAPAPPPTPAPVAMPAAGAGLITTTATPGSDSMGEPAYAHLSITSPPDWAAFPGTCTLYADGVAQAGALPSCNLSNQPVDEPYYESGTHEYWVVATDPSTGRTVESAHASQRVLYRFDTGCVNSASERPLTGGTLLQRPICNQCPIGSGQVCQIPFAQLPGQPSRKAADVARLIAGGVREAR